MFTSREQTRIAKARALYANGLPIWLRLSNGIYIGPRRSC